MATPSASTANDFLEHLPLIERIIGFVRHRYHLSAEEAEEFSSLVKIALLKDDCALLRRCREPEKLAAYLTVVVSRLLLDHRTSQWGKWRPSTEARRHGEVGQLLDRLISRDGFTFEEAFETMAINYGITVPRAELEQLAARLPVRVRRRFDSEDVLAVTPSADISPEDAAAERDRATTAERVGRALKRVLATLPQQDRLILTLHFKDGRRIVDIAALLRAPQKQLYRRLDRILAQLRDALEREGVDRSTIAELLR